MARRQGLLEPSKRVGKPSASVLAEAEAISAIARAEASSVDGLAAPLLADQPAGASISIACMHVYH